jgi:hypothetical protein
MRVISIRLAESDIATLTDRATAGNMTVSQYIRSMVMAERPISGDTRILLAEIMRNRQIMATVDGCDDVVDHLEAISPDVFVERAMAMRRREK